MSAIYDLHKIVTSDGEVLNVQDGMVRFVINDPEPLGFPPVEPVVNKHYQYRGETYDGFNLDARDLIVQVRFQGCSRSQMLAFREQLVRVLTPYRGLVTYTIGREGVLRSITGLVTDLQLPGSTESKWDQWGISDRFTIHCFDPVWFNPITSVNALVQTSSPQLVFPITFPITFGAEGFWNTLAVTYRGDFPTKPTIRLTGAATYLEVVHVELGHVLAWSFPVESGATVVFDLENDTIQDLVGNDLYRFLEPSTDLENLAIYPIPVVAGGVNTLEVRVNGTDGNTAVQINFNERYLGI